MSNSLSEIPVVEFWDGVVGAPIVGVLDSDRTHRLMTDILEEVHERKARVVIIDISGVPSVDTEVSKNLMSLLDAVELMGASAVISGVRPEVAQTVVDLGIELDRYTTTTSLSLALERAFDLMNLEVRPADGG